MFQRYKQTQEKKSTLRCAPSLLFSHGEKLDTTQRGASQGRFLLLGLFIIISSRDTRTIESKSGPEKNFGPSSLNLWLDLKWPIWVKWPYIQFQDIFITFLSCPKIFSWKLKIASVLKISTNNVCSWKILKCSTWEWQIKRFQWRYSSISHFISEVMTHINDAL